MDVNQICFQSIRDFSGKPEYRKGTLNNAGVYLWGFSLERDDYTIPSKPSMFFPYYVGKNDDVFCRIFEHIATLSGGNFSIFDVLKCYTDGTLIGKVQKDYQESSKKAKPIGSGPVLPNIDFPNLLHFPEGLHTSLRFFDKKNVVSPIVDWMVKHFCVTCFMPTSQAANDIIALEKIIGNLVGYDRLITTKYSNPDVEVNVINGDSTILLKTYEDIFTRCYGSMTGAKFGV